MDETNDKAKSNIISKFSKPEAKVNDRGADLESELGEDLVSESTFDKNQVIQESKGASVDAATNIEAKFDAANVSATSTTETDTKSDTHRDIQSGEVSTINDAKRNKLISDIVIGMSGSFFTEYYFKMKGRFSDNNIKESCDEMIKYAEILVDKLNDKEIT